MRSDQHVRRVRIHLTGFGPFAGVSNNPSSLIVQHFGQTLTANKRHGSDVNLASATVLETSGRGSAEQLKEIVTKNDTLDESDDETTHTCFVHLGVHGGLRRAFNIEHVAHNEAAFRVPDQRGWQPRSTVIEADDGHLARRRTTSVDCAELRNKLAERWTSKDVRVNVSTHPGRFVCNWIYYHSLKHTESRARSTSIFLHIPPASTMSVEEQTHFVEQFLSLLSHQLEERVTSETFGCVVDVMPTTKMTMQVPPGCTPIVLVNCGSFNPPTNLHLRSLEIARDAIEGKNEEHIVIAGFLSPVSNGYAKKGLIDAHKRVAMCELATESSDWITCEGWEASLVEFTPTVDAMRRFLRTLNRMWPGSEEVQLRFVCGADLFETFQYPNIWPTADVEAMAGEFGIVCIDRSGSDATAAMKKTEALSNHEDRVLLVRQLIPNDISSTRVRAHVSKGLSIRYLTPDGVLAYIYENCLYVNLADGECDAEEATARRRRLLYSQNSIYS